MQPLASRDGVVLRRAVESDLPEILALLRADPLGATRESTEIDDYRPAFEAIDADSAHLLLVAERDGVVATLQLTFLPGLSHRGAKRAQIEGVRVREDLRGQGLGGWLVGCAVDEARRRGAAIVQLTSDLTRTEAQRFYLRMGFVASHVGFKLSL